MTNEFNRETSRYLEDFSFDEEAFRQTEDRLDLIHKIHNKYGNTTDAVREYYNKTVEKWGRLQDYEVYRLRLEKDYIKVEKKCKHLCEELTEIRTETAGELQNKIKVALEDLNFLDVRFEIRVRSLEHFTKSGGDEVEFLIATNPGEDVKPLAKVASGGELSRIMLASKSVLADGDSIGTLVFDEIDAGISGRTAQRVSEKLSQISRKRQIICITHLAQIASMADNHYIIEKNSINEKTQTGIRLLDEEQSIAELARILGGAKITEAVTENAKEMKALANAFK